MVSWCRCWTLAVISQGPLSGQGAGQPGPGRVASSTPAWSWATRRLCGCHLFSWLHCLATACPGLLSAQEGEAFLHGPPGRTRNRALARAAPRDGFSDYGFPMGGLLRHVADSVPSGAFLERAAGRKKKSTLCLC